MATWRSPVYCLSAVLAGLPLLLPVRPAQADPAVQGIIAASVPVVIWGLFSEEPWRLEPDQLAVGGDWFDGVDGEDSAAGLRLEYRSGQPLWKLKPIFGLSATTDAAVYGYAGLRFDVYFARNFVISPSIAAAAYYEGDGKDLGSNLLLRSGLEAAYQFEDRSRLGINFYHMSHGEVFGDDNPGTETFGVTYSTPTYNLFGG